MLHSLEQRYVKLRDEHSKIKQQRDELLGKESTFESRLAEEQRASREVCVSETLSCTCRLEPHYLRPHIICSKTLCFFLHQ